MTIKILFLKDFFQCSIVCCTTLFLFGWFFLTVAQDVAYTYLTQKYGTVFFRTTFFFNQNGGCFQYVEDCAEEGKSMMQQKNVEGLDSWLVLRTALWLFPDGEFISSGSFSFFFCPVPWALCMWKHKHFSLHPTGQSPATRH